MSARDRILQRISQNKPEKKDLPAIPLFSKPQIDLLSNFTAIIEKIGGKVFSSKPGDVHSILTREYGQLNEVIDLYHNPEMELDQNLEIIELAVLCGEFGVAENGAVWIQENQLKTRVLPVITQHLVLVISKQDLVWNMHEAYERIQNIQSYGLFIAGPSKTADIEQSLVIGAHGPVSMAVILVEG